MIGEHLVMCEVCGKYFNFIGTGHLRSHGMKAEDYRLKYPEAKFSSKQTLEKMKEAAKLRPPQTEEKKKRISETMKRIYRETDFPVRHSNENQFGENNHFFGKSHTKESKEKMGIAATKWLKEAYKTGRKISPFQYLGQAKEMSGPEKAVYQILEPLGFVYDYPISFSKGRYLIDFALVDQKFGIELDSPLHDKTKEVDRRKDEFLHQRGWKIIRVPFGMMTPNQEIISMVKEVLKKELIANG